VSLPTGDQTSIIWIVKENKLKELVKEGLIHIVSPELSMEIGKDFEERVKKYIVE
jgi:hypothetical protein